MKNKFKSLLCLCAFTTVFCLYWIVFSRNQTKNVLKSQPLHNPHLYQPSVYPGKVCAEYRRAVLVVTSYVGHVELRSAHRRAMPLHYLNAFNATRVFLLAQIPSAEKYITQSAIDNESARFGDILQGSFVEHYRNLTYKHLMGLHWAATRCARSEYIIKVDDDTVFNFEKIYTLLAEYEPTEKLMAGYVLSGTRPHRERQNKWYVSPAEYPHSEYPPYVSGWLYVTTPMTAISLAQAAAYHPYFWIDDIFITGILTSELNIKIQNMKAKNIWLEYYELLECCLRDMMDANVKCEYAVAPNGGRNNLIFEFNEAVRRCEHSSDCKSRSDGRRLTDTCVVESERRVFGDGKSQVQVVRL